MSILSGLTWYYSLYGFRGVFAICSYRAFGRPKEISVRPPGIQWPVHIRIKTSDELIYKETLLCRQYAIDLPFLPKTIVDAGANIGTASIYFAQAYPEARIIAIEAEASNFEVLVRNVRRYPAIIPIHAALWKHDGEIQRKRPRTFYWGLRAMGICYL